MQKISVRLSDDLVDRIAAEAVETERTTTQVIRLALRRYFDGEEEYPDLGPSVVQSVPDVSPVVHQPQVTRIEAERDRKEKEGDG